MGSLTFQDRPAASDASGLLVLHHGRGADERDLLGLGEMLDPGGGVGVASHLRLVGQLLPEFPGVVRQTGVCRSLKFQTAAISIL